MLRSKSIQFKTLASRDYIRVEAWNWTVSCLDCSPLEEPRRDATRAANGHSAFAINGSALSFDRAAVSPAASPWGERFVAMWLHGFSQKNKNEISAELSGEITDYILKAFKL